MKGWKQKPQKVKSSKGGGAQKNKSTTVAGDDGEMVPGINVSTV